VLWPRGTNYYTRNNWAGRIKSVDNSDWILDSPISNAAAHYLHNMFYILGKTIDQSAEPADITAELYRANNIENFDTAALRCHTKEGVEIFFCTSHAILNYRGPLFEYEFEKAVVRYETDGYGEDNPHITAQFKDGTTKDYGLPDTQSWKKIYDVVDSVSKNTPVVCSAGSALAQIICTNGAQDSAGQIIQFPDSVMDFKESCEGPMVYVKGLSEVLIDCYNNCLLPSEIKIHWAHPSKLIDLKNYNSFPA
jgi:hypothetical protein